MVTSRAGWDIRPLLVLCRRLQRTLINHTLSYARFNYIQSNMPPKPSKEKPKIPTITWTPTLVWKLIDMAQSDQNRKARE